MNSGKSILCPKCKSPNEISIEAWRENLMEIKKSKCAICRNDIYVGLFIVANDTPKKINRMITAIVEMVKKANGKVNQQ